MALLDDMTKSLTSPSGLAVGIGTLLLAPVLAPALARIARPLAKGVLSTGIGLYRQTVEPLRHGMTELVAEARMELAGQHQPAGAGEAEPPREAAVRAHRKASKD